MPQRRPHYLDPYLRSAQKHGAGFQSLLWASPATQAARFDALSRLHDLNGVHLLDIGCGRGDLLPFLLSRQIVPARYIGLEAVPALAEAARQTIAQSGGAAAEIHELDFVKTPDALDRSAEVLLFSGSLNTLDRPTFYSTLQRAYDAASRAVLFNFLSSQHLAAVDWLTWHPPSHVLAHCRRLAHRVDWRADYLDGDCSICLTKPH